MVKHQGEERGDNEQRKSIIERMDFRSLLRLTGAYERSRYSVTQQVAQGA